MNRVLAAALALGLAAGAAASCSLLLPLDDVQCVTAADCAARGGAFAGAACVNNVCAVAPVVDGSSDAGSESAPSGPWGCLDEPPLPSDPNEKVDIQFTLFDVFQPWTLGGTVDGGNDLMLLQGTPEVGVAIQACDTLDPLCANPVAVAPLSDDAGVTHVSVLGGFSGFYSMTRADSFPTLFFPGRLLANEPHVSYPTGTLLNQAASGVGSVIGITLNADPDAGLGHVFYAAFDCNERHAAGVSFSLLNTDAGTRFYLQNKFPNTRVGQTDISGTGGWLNVPAGNIEVAMTLVAGNRPLGTRNVLVRSGQASLVFVRPRVR
jgi:hypothetical protein